MEEFFKQLFGGQMPGAGAEGQDGDDAGRDGSSGRGPSMGFTGNPGAGQGSSSSGAGQGGFPGMLPASTPRRWACPWTRR